MPSHDRGATLLPIARGAIAQALLARPALMHEDVHWLHEPGATFVTLTRHGALRGCIGSLEARRRLIDDVRANAVAAALRDPRFAPLTPREYDQVRVGVSLLSPMQPMDVHDEADALAQLQVGIDGLVFECHGRRSTFLPQVWEQLAAPRDFLGQLKAKAGFATDFWAADVRLQRYTVTKWAEDDADMAEQGGVHAGAYP
ncbi:AmmeMemoRadiSam system protein A [Comamonadaceae bacterium G21597-S1]|nr:AmmeMemoRadiSam system protein A [Comamonadaceae bacterium G21597-S1]